MKVNSYWEIKNGDFIKHFFDQFDESIAKYQSLYAVASRNNFTAPKILSDDHNANTASFEYINGLTSIRESYIEFMTITAPNEDMLDLFHMAGVVLGAIHGEMKLEVQDAWRAPACIENVTSQWLGRGNYLNLHDTPHAFIHGDYGFSNVNIIISGDNNSLAIIDPCPNYYYTFRVNLFASVYIDLATFLSCLDGRVPIRHYRRFQWSRLNLIKEAFLDGYESRTGCKVNRCLLACLTCAVTESYFIRKYGSGLRSLIAHKVIHNARKKNLPESYCADLSSQH